MGTNYTNVCGLKRSTFIAGDNTDALLNEEGGRIEELHYDRYQGDIRLHFFSEKRPKTWERSLLNGGYIRIEHTEELEDKDSHIINIPIKANNDWNDFAESLPRWDG